MAIIWYMLRRPTCFRATLEFEPLLNWTVVVNWVYWYRPWLSVTYDIANALRACLPIDAGLRLRLNRAITAPVRVHMAFPARLAGRPGEHLVNCLVRVRNQKLRTGGVVAVARSILSLNCSGEVLARRPILRRGGQEYGTATHPPQDPPRTSTQPRDHRRIRRRGHCRCRLHQKPPAPPHCHHLSARVKDGLGAAGITWIETAGHGRPKSRPPCKPRPTSSVAVLAPNADSARSRGAVCARVAAIVWPVSWLMAGAGSASPRGCTGGLCPPARRWPEGRPRRVPPRAR
jgi:hypothetical protein